MDIEVTGHSGRVKVYDADDAEHGKEMYIEEFQEPARWAKVVNLWSISLGVENVKPV